MLSDILTRTREQKPLIHCISNMVTANDCANLLLSCGAGAIMAQDPAEAAEVTARSQGLVLNLGTPSQQKLEAMALAGAAANRLGHPVVFDPVGVGSSAFRREGAEGLLEQVKFTVIRGNGSEIATLATGAARGNGVETAEESCNFVEIARKLAVKTGAIVALTGETDILTDGKMVYRIHGGHPCQRLVTGCGCMLSCLLGACVSANRSEPFQAALAALCAMKTAAEIAGSRMTALDGNGSFRRYLLDAVCNLTADDLERGAKYEIL